MLGDYVGPDYINMFDKVILCLKLVKLVYNLLFVDVDTLLKQSYKRQRSIDPTIRSDNLIKAVNDGWQSTNYPKLRSFHYRIIANTLITNVQLFYHKINPSKLCTFCEKEDEFKALVFEL